MSCLAPMIAIKTGNLTEKGKDQFRIIPRNKLKHPYEYYLKNKSEDIRLLPCGRCIECRLAYSRRWADRLMLELEERKKAMFVTLTYDNEHLPVSMLNDDGSVKYATVSKEDCQKFLKRLRKNLPEIDWRYYLSSEYGPTTLRPHYHMILFGLGIDDLQTCNKGCRCDDCNGIGCPAGEFWNKKEFHSQEPLVKVPSGKNELGQVYYEFPVLRKIWKNGFIGVSDVSYETCAYVSRYITGKLTGDPAISYAERNCAPEFSLMSKNPAIGLSYLKKHPDILDYNSIYLSTPTGGRKIEIPQYFLRRMELTNQEGVDIIRERRKLYAENKEMYRMANTSLDLETYLANSERRKLKEIAVLHRADL